MCIAKKSDEELKDYLKFELAPFPLSLFSEEGMRKGTKSALYTLFTQVPEGEELGNNKINVVDGGYLLHKVVWHRNDSFATICDKYVQYVLNHYGPCTVVVFDGYPSDGEAKNTKTAERLRRSKKQMSADVHFDETMAAQVSQERFLANEHNKVRLITMLTGKLKQADVTVKQAEEDADVLIVNTAITLSSSYDAVFIVGEDVDLLVLLISLSSQGNVYLRKPGRGKTAEKLYNTSCLKNKVVAENILFLHAFSGCDTTSSLFGQGKSKFCSLLQKHDRLNAIISIFKDCDAKPEDIADAGERFLVVLYGGDMEKDTLEKLRYQRFAKSATKSKVSLASLPPTNDAARYHAYRTYHQVQKWHGIQKNPEDWGWLRGTNGLAPVTMTDKPAPETLLNFISCHCKKGCGRGACGCRKAGLMCSIVCKFCNGQCENAPQLHTIDSDNEDEESLENQIMTRIENELIDANQTITLTPE